jgi:hypothetical protein
MMVAPPERMHELLGLLCSDAPGWMKEFAESQILDLLQAAEEPRRRENAVTSRAKTVKAAVSGSSS